jgi:hypothetical protein
MRPAWMKLLFWSLNDKTTTSRCVICYTRPADKPEGASMLIHVFHSGAIPGSTGYFGYTLKRVPSDLPTMQTGPWRKFGGPIEVMPGEPRAGITEDVLAEIRYRGFSMREHMVTVAQKRVRDRAG